mmetsp:Transcript_11941/g.28985  ORF Transcript_11941/g.28985 Transcript_11941/m.28985 type:complete len:110 (+) Transcript_11941:1033-1362(+)
MTPILRPQTVLRHEADPHNTLFSFQANCSQSTAADPGVMTMVNVPLSPQNSFTAYYKSYPRDRRWWFSSAVEKKVVVGSWKGARLFDQPLACDFMALRAKVVVVGSCGW